MQENRFRTPEAAEIIGVKPDTLEKWRRMGKGPRFWKPGGRVFYFESDLATYIASVTHDPKQS